MKICFITSLFSNSYEEADKPITFEKLNKYDYYLFTNLDKNNFNTSWDIIQINNLDEINKCNSFITKSRYIKFLGWKYIKEILKKKYDTIFYCDSTYEPKININWEDYSNKIINSKSGIFQTLHKRNIKDELIKIITSEKDTYNKIDVTKNFLIKNKMPYNYRITENTAFGYDPNNKKLIEYFNHFWELYSKETLTHRDQIIWGFICWKYNIYPIIYKKNEKDLKKRRIHNYLFKYNKNSVGFNEHTYT
jgi:hypothetical protein